MTPDLHSSPLRIIHPETEPVPNVDRADGHRSERPAKQSAQLRTSWKADELMALTFPPPRWAVPGLVAEGVSLLAGPPKIGKSWLALALGLAVAAGGKVFDALDVEGGDVLYLALEDTPRRLQTRMRKILGGQPAPTRLTLATTCPTLPQGGADNIADWLDRHDDARLVVLDVFARLRGTSPPGMSAYDADYAAVSRVKQLADHHGVAVLLVHHVRKAGAEDFLAEVSGTNGIAGAADATLVLKRPRGEADGVLHVTGRDIDETDYALSFQPAAGAWHLLSGPPDEHTLPETRAAILRWLREHPGNTPKAIADALGLGHELVKKTCARMAADGQLVADATGRYRPTGRYRDPPEPVPLVPAVPELPLASAESGDGLGTPPVPARPATTTPIQEG